MKITTTLLLSLILASLGIYYFTFESSVRTAGAELSPSRILTLNQNDLVQRLEIQSNVTQETLQLKRGQTGWMIDVPVSYPAEDFMVEGMVSALTFSNRMRRFQSDGKDWKQYGLDSPAIKVGIETKNHPLKRYLLFGEKSPVVDGIYARWEDEKEYFLIAPQIRASFDRTLYSLRKKHLFRSRWDKLAWIDIQNEKKRFRLEKKNGKWIWVRPSPAGEIPVEKISDLVYSLQSLYIKEFLDGQEAKNPEFEFKVEDSFIAVGEAGGESERVQLGTVAKGKDARYAIRDQEKTVLLVSEGNLKSSLQIFEMTFQEVRESHR